MEVASLLLSGNPALWGVITPNIRRVSIFLDFHTINFYFYYDCNPSDLEIDLSEEAGTKVIVDFSGALFDKY